MQCRLCRYCIGCHSGHFYSSSCSEVPALRTQTKIMCLVGAHAMQAMQARRRLSLQSLLQQPMIRDACPANPNGDHVPSRFSCNAGYAGTASAVTTVLSTVAHARDPIPSGRVPSSQSTVPPLPKVHRRCLVRSWHWSRVLLPTMENYSDEQLLQPCSPTQGEAAGAGAAVSLDLGPHRDLLPLPWCPQVAETFLQTSR